MVVNYMHHGDDLVEHRAREASFGAQCTNHSANSMCASKFKVVFPEYEMFVLHQNIEHFDENSAENHSSSWQAKRKIKNFCPKFFIFLKFYTLEGIVI